MCCWSKVTNIRIPNLLQFSGVFFKSRSRLPQHCTKQSRLKKKLGTSFPPKLACIWPDRAEIILNLTKSLLNFWNLWMSYILGIQTFIFVYMIIIHFYLIMNLNNSKTLIRPKRTWHPWYTDMAVLRVQFLLFKFTK